MLNEKKHWGGQDNLKLPVSTFNTLCKWLDVDSCHHPVKDHIKELDKALTILSKEAMPGSSSLLRLKEDLTHLDDEIDAIMAAGGKKMPPKRTDITRHPTLADFLGVESDGTINTRDSYMHALLADMLDVLPGLIAVADDDEPAAAHAVQSIGLCASQFQKIIKELSD